MVEASKKNIYRHHQFASIILLGFHILLFSVCVAQSPAAYHLSEVYNFNVKTIYSLYQAKNQHIWMGTNQGLFKFDGTVFQKYLHHEYQTEYSYIQEDKEGRIWCNNFSGQIFYVEDDDLKLFRDINEYTIDGLLEFTAAHFPKIHIGTDYGYITVDFYDKNNLQHFQTDAYRKDRYKTLQNKDTIYADLIDQMQAYKNDLIYSNGNAVQLIQKDSIRSLFSTKGAYRRPFYMFSHDDKIISLYIDHDQILQIHSIQNNILRTKYYNKLPEPNISSIYYDKNTQKYWLGTTDGIFLFDKDFQTVEVSPHFLNGSSVSSIIKDHEGNYWAATLHDGIYIIPSMEILTLNNRNSSFIQNGLIDLKVVKNKLMLLDNSGNLYQYPLLGGQLTFLHNVGKGARNIVYNPIKENIYLNNINYVYDLNTKKLLISPKRNNIKAGTAIDSINFLVSSSLNAYIMNFENNKHKKPMNIHWQQKYKMIEYDKAANQLLLRLKRSYTNSMCNATKYIYVSYSDGLFSYNNAKAHEMTYNNQPIIATTLQTDDKKGIWAANIEGNLFYLFKNEVTLVSRFNTEIKHIRKKDSVLFLSTNNGLVKYNINSKQKNLINTLDGLPSNNITGLAIFDNTIYVATLKGLAKVPMGYNYRNTTPPEVTLKKMTINGKSHKLATPLKLKPTENNLTFFFNTYALRSQKTFTYAYRMLGIDSTWTTSSANSATFAALAPNQYNFQLKAINEDGVESTVIKSISFIIDKPFYQKWWFYVTLVTAAVSLASYIFSYRTKNLKKQHALQQRQEVLKKKLVASTITALKAQMNPHFTFNTMNSIQSLILRGNRDEAYNYLAKFSILLRENLNMSDKTFIYFDEELDMITTYLELEKLRLRTNFKYHITGTTAIEDIKIPAMIIQPFVENAMKHGLSHKMGMKKLTIDFRQKEALHCTIIDNGIGRSAAEAINRKKKRKHSPFATAAMEERFVLLREYYKLDLGFSYTDLQENNTPSGTQVTIKIPYLADND